MKRMPFLFAVLILSLFSAGYGFTADHDATLARSISLRECIEIALGNNINIAISQTEREKSEAGVQIEEAAFLPKFTWNLTVAQSIAPTNSVIDNNTTVDKRYLQSELVAADILPTGTILSLSLTNLRQETNSADALLSPQYLSGLTFSVEQPLLQNRGRKVTEAPLQIARAGALEKTGEWKTTVMDIVAEVRSTFLAYTFAENELDVRKKAVELAEQMIIHTDARIKGGAAAEIDLLPAASAAAARKEELIRAQASARSAEADLKNLLGMRSGADWEKRLLPIMTIEDISPTGPDDTYEEAIRRRPEIEVIKARKTQAEISEAAARNRTLPVLNLVASAGLAGLAGTPNPNPFIGGHMDYYTGRYSDSVDQMFSGKHYNWQIGIKTEIPWGMKREKAEWARSKAMLREQRLTEESVHLQIRNEVWKARVELESAIARINAARASTEAAGKNLEAEEKKLSVGRSTIVEVLRAQHDLSEARLAEVRANSDAHMAQTRLWRATGLILEKEGIEM